MTPLLVFQSQGGRSPNNHGPGIIANFMMSMANHGKLLPVEEATARPPVDRRAVINGSSTSPIGLQWWLGPTTSPSEDGYTIFWGGGKTAWQRIRRSWKRIGCSNSSSGRLRHPYPFRRSACGARLPPRRWTSEYETFACRTDHRPTFRWREDFPGRTRCRKRLDALTRGEQFDR